MSEASSSERPKEGRTRKRRLTIGHIDSYHAYDLHESLTAGQGVGRARTEVNARPNAKSRWATLRSSVHVGGLLQEIREKKRHEKKAIIQLSVVIVLSGCASAVPFELLNKADRGCSSLILLAQYLYATSECVRSGEVGTFVADRKIPIVHHVLFLFLFGITNVLLNAALDLGLPMPVYLVIKNGGLAVSMLLGWAVQSKSYRLEQVMGVLVITLGVIITTFASKPAQKSTESAQNMSTFSFLVAAASMALGVVSMSFLNIAQERAFKQHGKHFQETMFYQHVLGLPLFLLGSADLFSHMQTWSGMWGELPLPSPLNLSVPTMWLMLLLNISMAQIMKVSCLKLTNLAGSLTNVLVVTIFRFVSLLVSAVVINSPPFPPLSMWFGSFLVLGGTIMYLLCADSAPAPGAKEK